MRKFTAAFFLNSLFFASSAMAGTMSVALVKGAEVPYLPKGLADVQSHFEYDLQTGRAWVEVTLTEASTNYDDVAPDTYTDRIKVPGLSLNRDSGEILFQPEGLDHPIVCAQVQNKKLLFMKWKALKLTGKCVLKASRDVVETDEDDGFRVVKNVKHLYRVGMLVTE